MHISTHREFDKSYKKLRLGEKVRYQARKQLFIENPYNPILENHPLKGKYEGCDCFHVGGDLVVIYICYEIDKVTFLDIGTHHQLFGK